MFCSQQGEDIYLLKNLINKKCDDGIFVEIGAVDGLTYSNTFFLENTFNFKGILVEANKNMFNKLIINRPNNILVNKAISISKEPVKFIGNTPTGGIEKHMTETFKNNWHKHSNSYFIETEQFSNLFEKHNIKYIDFFSLDVEGGELDVLQTIDFNKVNIYIFCIELDGHNKEKDEKCREILKNNNFVFKDKLFINEFWINNNYYRKDKLFDNHNKIIFKGIDQNTKRSNLGIHYSVEPHLITNINNFLSD